MTGRPVHEAIERAGGRLIQVERPGGVRLRAAVFGAGPVCNGEGGNGERGGSPRRCLLLHGYTEFIEKHLETIGELTGRGFEVVTFDWRGQGLSTRALADRHRGHIDRMETHLEDLQAVLDCVDGSRDRPLTVVAHSMGGHIALRYCIAAPDRVARAILIAPMLGIGRTGLPTGLARLLVEGFCRTPMLERYIFGGAGYGPRRQRFEGNPLTGDRERFEALHRLLVDCPELAVGDPTFAWVRAAFRSIALLGVPGVLERIRTPLLLALAGRERVVSNAAIEAAARRLPAARLARFEDARHEILREREPIRQAFWQAVDGFLAATGA